MPDSSEANASEPLAFPADARTIALRARDLVGAGVVLARFTLAHATDPAESLPFPGAPGGDAGVLHIRLVPQVPWLTVSPQEVALSGGAQQAVRIRVDIARAVKATSTSETLASGEIRLVYQRLAVAAERGVAKRTGEGSVFVRLPFNNCPNCALRLDDTTESLGELPALCPRCFERLRACPICAAPNSWLARVCVVDSSHVVRDAPDFPQLGGSAQHTGLVARKSTTALSRRWSFPNVPPARPEDALSFCAPAAAYGMIAVSAASPSGDAFLYAFDSGGGAPLYEPYPLPDPVYPERGGVALMAGKLYAATVEGAVVCVDALRGSRVWERALSGRVFGSVTPVGKETEVRRQESGDRSQEKEAASVPHVLLVALSTPTSGGGMLVALHAETGATLWEIALTGLPDTAPAADSSATLAFVHDDGGSLTCVRIADGTVLWTSVGMGGINAAPVVGETTVYSASQSGHIHCHDVRTGKKLWETQATSKPFHGTPALDGALLYAPADDALHIISTSGKAVRRYGQRFPVRSAPVVVGGIVFFGGGDGRLYGARAGQTPDSLYETGVGSRISAPLAFADDLLIFTATNGVLYALGAA